MGISFSEIQSKTLLQYAKKIDDGDGDLNREEMMSLFHTVSDESTKVSNAYFNQSPSIWQPASIVAGAGVISGGLKLAISHLEKKNGVNNSLAGKAYKFVGSAKGFGVLALTGLATYITSHIIMGNKEENLNEAYIECCRLIYKGYNI